MTVIRGKVNSIVESLSSSRIPIHTTVVLTNRCNFSCDHCYRRSEPIGIGELDFDEWKTILDTLQGHGCLFLKITGGEPLLYKNFLEVYEYAYKNGFFIELCTNGMLISEQTLNLLTILKPDYVTISLYGASDVTYSRFCHVSSGFTCVINNIKLLKDAGINIRLQTVLNRVNYEDLPQMKHIASELFVPFHCYRNIHCDTAGVNNSNLIVDSKSFIDSVDIMGDRINIIDSVHRSDQLWNSGYKYCTAGLCACNIDPQGFMYLCNQDTNKKISLLDNEFDRCWNQMYLERLNDIEVKIECSDCECKGFCGLCNPAYLKESKSIHFKEYCEDRKLILKKLIDYEIK